MNFYDFFDKIENTLNEVNKNIEIEVKKMQEAQSLVYENNLLLKNQEKRILQIKEILTNILDNSKKLEQIFIECEFYRGYGDATSLIVAIEKLRIEAERFNIEYSYIDDEDIPF